MKHSSWIGVFLLACLSLLLAGCGGGGGAATPVGSAKFTFTWPSGNAMVASRAGIADANSLVVEIGGQRGILQRPDTELTIPGVPTGTQRYTMHTYASTNGTGNPLTEAEGVLPIADGQLIEEAVSGDSNSALQLLLGQLVVSQHLTVEIGKTTQLTVTAINAEGAVVLVALNGFTWQSSHPSFATVNNGLITGVTEGVSTITTTYGTLTVHGTVTVTDPNTPPTASFTATPTTGDVTTTFQYDASGCTDAQNAVSALQVRWDWEGDGTYDTAFSTTKTAQHAYATAGVYTVHLQVKDTGGKMATAEKTVTVKVKLTVTPVFVTLTLGQQQAFTAHVQGSTQTSVSWRVQETNGGSITDGGRYTAPLTAGTYHVIATSQADETVSVSVPVFVQGTIGTVIVQ